VFATSACGVGATSHASIDGRPPRSNGSPVACNAATLTTARESRRMMVAVFGTMLLAFTFAWLGRRPVAIASFVASLLLAVGLFLFEVYSPEYGFRMPWIQTHAAPIADASA
jgi:hypothetical protein